MFYKLLFYSIPRGDVITMELPAYVIEKLKKIAERLGVDLASVQKEYEEMYNDPFVQKDPQFKTDEQRHKWCSGAFWSRNMTRRQALPTDVIPIGVDFIKKQKSSGMPQTSLFVLDKRGKLRRVSMQGDICFATKNMSFMSLYEGVKLSEYKDSSDLGADDRAKFENPVAVDFNPLDLLERLKVEKVTIVEAPDHLSKKDSAGYPNKNDWKCIRGFVGFSSQTGYEEGDFGEWGRITISDDTVDSEKTSISAGGDVIYPGFTLMVSPTLQNYPRDSECYFLGPIVERKRKDKTGHESIDIVMNCYCIVPIIITRTD